MSTLDHVSTQEKYVKERSVEYVMERVRLAATRLERLTREPSPVDEARAQLRHWVREAHQAGHSYRAIAEAAGISHQRVAQILAKEGK